MTTDAVQAEKFEMFIDRLILAVVDHVHEKIETLTKTEFSAHVAVTKEIIQQTQSNMTIFFVGFAFDGENEKSKDFTIA